MTTLTSESLQRRVDAAQGRIPCDVVIKNVRFLDVFTCKWRPGDISIIDGCIVGIEPGLKGKREIDGTARAVVPGFIDAHVHVESSLMMPHVFDAMVLPKGTTSAVCDPHELANVKGVSGIEYFLEQASELKLNLQVMLSSCVPATHLETNGGGKVTAEQLVTLAGHPHALGLAEMMNVPGVLNGDPEVMAKLLAFSNHRIDGHCPLVRGQALSAYASVGISSCHESTQFEEAQEKLIKGISVWIREGSVAKDLNELVPLLNLANSTSVGFCTDDRNPKDIADEGHLDFLIRRAIAKGVSPEVAYRAASWTVARHYGFRDRGAIAPGYQADLVMLSDFIGCEIAEVLSQGRLVSELEFSSSAPTSFENTVLMQTPEAKDLEGPSGQVHVIVVEAGKIITGRKVDAHNAPGVARLSVVERYGKGSPPANGYVSGFGESFEGAIASSVGHDSHNLIVVGQEARDMKVALQCIKEMGGGFCVVHHEKVLASLPLPFGGLMTSESPESVVSSLRNLHEASHSIGCQVPEPFLQLAFLSLPVIPSLKLTDQGLVDVDKFSFINVSAA